MTIKQYCHLVHKSIDLRGVHFYDEHLMKILKGKVNYKLYIEEELHKIDFLIEILASTEY